jgi:hypothetical protein
MSIDEIDALEVNDLPPEQELKGAGLSMFKATPEGLTELTEKEKLQDYKDHLKLEKRKAEPDPPQPDEAKRMLIEKAEQDWGYTPMQLNRIKRDYPILFDFISAEKYEKAKKFLKRLHTEEGVIEYHELQWSLDMLEGRESIELI